MPDSHTMAVYVHITRRLRFRMWLASKLLGITSRVYPGQLRIIYTSPELDRVEQAR